MMISNDELSEYQGSSGKHLFESTCLGFDILKRIPVIHNQRRSIGNVLSRAATRAFKFTSSISMLTFQD